MDPIPVTVIAFFFKEGVISIMFGGPMISYSINYTFQFKIEWRLANIIVENLLSKDGS